MNENTLNKIINIIRHNLSENGMSVSSSPTNSTNPPGQVNIAGLPPDQPPVDLRRGKRKNWNPFFKDLARIQRRKPPQ